MPGTTGGLTPIRGNDAYIGWAKQALWGTAVAPTYYWRWLDGSAFGPEEKLAHEREGDTSPFIAYSYKNSQVGMVKIVEYARPITAGCALQALLCSGSDAYVAPSKTSTLAANVLVGDTTFQSVADLGNVGAAVAHAFEAGYASPSGEVVVVDLTTRTGAGTPWTYTLAAAGTFKLAHTAAGAISTQATHALTRQVAAYDAYTLEWALGHSGSTPAQAFRMQDAVCTEVKMSGRSNGPIRLEHTWYGALTKIQAALGVPAFEGVGAQGSASAPFRFDQAGTAWLVDGSNAGNAAQIKAFDIVMKNTTDPGEFIAEGLTPTYFQPGDFDVQGSFQAVFQSFSHYNLAYFGSKTPAALTSDSNVVGMGSFATTFAMDGVNSLAVNMPLVAFEGPKLTPKLDGKSLEQPLSFIGQKGQGVTNPLAVTLTNAQAAAY